MDKVKAFKVALASSGYRTSELARMWGCSKQAIHRVIRGQTTSRRLKPLIDAFIDGHLERLQEDLRRVA
ncbi:MAG TPA: hypothetical protein ENJ29_02505 [Bacteroidetes bacterium]|nr:hypothetical protein [Bacteroidota bacterium]